MAKLLRFIDAIGGCDYITMLESLDKIKPVENADILQLQQEYVREVIFSSYRSRLLLGAP